MKKCLVCYKELENGERDFHEKCSKKLFGQKQAPELPYSHDTLTDLAREVVKSQTTITGVQPKLSLDFLKETDTTRFTIVGLWGRYILKPQTKQYNSLPELEDLTMHLAETAGLNTVPHGLIRFADGKLGYITRRIDRSNSGYKYSMEDFCQLTGNLTEFKYRGSYEKLAKTLKNYSSSPFLDLVNFWEIVLFSWITGNADMHLKNFSLISYKPGEHTLSPAYDLISTTLVLPSDPEEMALSVNGKKRKLKKMDFESAMLNSGLTQKQIENIFLKFKNINLKWQKVIDISFLPDEMKENLLTLITNRLKKIF